MELQKPRRLIEDADASGSYDAPRVEFVLTAEELEREGMIAIVASPD